jgi:hypothetical protein
MSKWQAAWPRKKAREIILAVDVLQPLIRKVVAIRWLAGVTPGTAFALQENRSRFGR